MVSRRLLTLWVACFWTALRLGKPAMDFHLDWVSGMLSASFAVSGGFLVQVRRGRRGGWRVWREFSAVHGSLRLGGEEVT